MRRDEAVAFLKEVMSSCANMSPDSVTLSHAQSADSEIVGYQVHIKTVLDKKTKQQVQKIAEKHSVDLKQEKDELVVYKPKKAAQVIQ